MLKFLADKISVTVLTLSQLLLSNVVGTDPWFENVGLQVTETGLHLSATLLGTTTEDLDIMLQSGDTLVINFEVDLIEQETKQVVAMGNWSHAFRYSLLDDSYDIHLSEEDRTRTLYEFDRAKQRWATVENAFICELDDLNDENHYYLRMSAYMDAVDLPGLTSQLNLMSFWNQIRPVYTSEPFLKRHLVMQ